MQKHARAIYRLFTFRVSDRGAPSAPLRTELGWRRALQAANPRPRHAFALARGMHCTREHGQGRPSSRHGRSSPGFCQLARAFTKDLHVSLRRAASLCSTMDTAKPRILVVED